MPGICQDVVRRFAGCGVAVVGDLMLDRYVWGTATRISQEAPVPVVRVRSDSSAPGGAANVVRNICSMGARSWAFGMAGQDQHGDALVSALEQLGAATAGIVRQGSRPTTVKTRVLAGGQQVVRIDREESGPVSQSVSEEICRRIRERMETGAVGAVILEDYAKGLLSRDMVARIVRDGRANGVMVALDPHSRNAFEVPGLKLLTPNRAEAFALAGVYPEAGRLPVEEDGALLHVADRLLQSWRPDLLLITLGGHGMALFRPNKSVLHVPTKAREVFDVSGAGDTVMAAFVLALLAGATHEEAACIANHAAGIVVAEVGTAGVTAGELLEDLARG